MAVVALPVLCGTQDGGFVLLFFSKVVAAST